ncbi:MAG TPA: long-chain fatty acid--CoA ligase [Verrucomicrobiae bacterium]|jgi:hypothetical protein
MAHNFQLADFAAQLRGWFRRTATTGQPLPFEELALQLFALQFEHNAAYRRLSEARTASPASVRTWNKVPPAPTAAFKERELTALEPARRVTVFHSSGTTAQKPSRHFHSHESLALYESSVTEWFRPRVLPDWSDRREFLDFLALTPSPALAPHSSLAHMFATVQREFGQREQVFTGAVNSDGAWALDLEATLSRLRASEAAGEPLVVLGTAFSFVHLLDHLTANDLKLNLPAGSRAMETGGYKGRSRELPKAELHELITERLGIPPPAIVCEYGMSELSSQAYDTESFCVPHSAFRIFHFPPWCRAVVISPETGREVAEGETGLLRVYDLANVWSVMAIQTEDLAVRRGDGFELLGRARLAEPRGCSLMPG